MHWPMRPLGIVKILSIITSVGASNPLASLGCRVWRMSGLSDFKWLVIRRTVSDPFPSNVSRLDDKARPWLARSCRERSR